VSGHRDLTKEEFEEHYAPLIETVLKEDIWAEFIVGDWEGCDTMFIEYMISKRSYPDIVVTCVENPRIKPFGEDLFHYCKTYSKLCNTYDECDAFMTQESDFDIAWIRPGREDSHTAKNIRRRYNL
jgi:siroheme synthase (precorrin-2 oxidase/ferrochelatase)